MRHFTLGTRSHVENLSVGNQSTQNSPPDLGQSSLSAIAGKTLNALTLDPVERDTLVADRINELIDWGVQRYGPESATQLKQDMGLEQIGNSCICVHLLTLENWQ